jgi:hypothetical protein
VRDSNSKVSGVAHKYTDKIDEKFGSGSAELFYAITQEVNSQEAREKDPKWWLKREALKLLYEEELPKGEGEEAAKSWESFYARHPKTTLELRVEELRAKHGAKSQEWTTFLSETRLRLLSLLLLNVRNVQK